MNIMGIPDFNVDNLPKLNFITSLYKVVGNPFNLLQSSIRRTGFIVN